MKWEEFKKKYADKLNDEQIEAVKQVDGQVLLLAVPGSGKTTTLIMRVGYMIKCCKISPEEILTITFTKAAAADMDERYGSIFGKNAKRPKFSTIHSLCYSMLNENADLVGEKLPDILPNNASVITQLYYQLFDEYPSESDVREAAQQITYIKNMMIPIKEIKTMKCGSKSIYPLYRAYQKEMEERNQIDFDDLLTIAYANLKRKDGKLLKRMQGKYSYILLDEAQDTSHIQHEIIKIIARKKKNIFMVGDEDQSIYAFRGAYPEALLHFSEQYKEAKVLYLETNYRSVPTIVNTAQSFIRQNVHRYNKNMLSIRDNIGGVHFQRTTDQKEQYRTITANIHGINPSDEVAILYRNNDSAVPLIYHLSKDGISFKCRDMDTSFFNHPAVKDVRNIWLLYNDPFNVELFMKLYYKFGLKIRKQDAIRATKSVMTGVDQSLFESLYRVKRGALGLERRLMELIEHFRKLRYENAKQALTRICYSMRASSKSDQIKYSILLSMVDPNETMDEYIQKLEKLEKDIKNGVSDQKSRITLSTMHGSKGLEFDRVIVIDVVAGVFPHPDSDKEEERRLMYVAMTRAKTDLVLMEYTGKKMPFIEEIQSPGRSCEGKDDHGFYRKQTIITPPAKASPDCPDYLKSGTKIKHASEGRGVIISVDDEYVEVQFGKNVKTYMLDICLKKGLLQKI